MYVIVTNYVNWRRENLRSDREFIKYNLSGYPVTSKTYISLSFLAGYVYVLFDNEKSVRALLQACTHDYTTGEYYIRISSRRMKSKEVSRKNIRISKDIIRILQFPVLF